MMFLKILILSIILIAIAAIGFGITLIIKPRGKFPELHIDNNHEMSNRGITCARDIDMGCRSAGCPACEDRLP
jgi:hypothetical protein